MRLVCAYMHGLRNEAKLRLYLPGLDALVIGEIRRHEPAWELHRTSWSRVSSSVHIYVAAHMLDRSLTWRG